MRRRLTKGLLIVLAVLALLPAVGVWYAVHTESGLKMVVNFLSRKLGPVTVEPMQGVKEDIEFRLPAELRN